MNSVYLRDYILMNAFRAQKCVCIMHTNKLPAHTLPTLPADFPPEKMRVLQSMG